MGMGSTCKVVVMVVVFHEVDTSAYVVIVILDPHVIIIQLQHGKLYG